MRKKFDWAIIYKEFINYHFKILQIFIYRIIYHIYINYEECNRKIDRNFDRNLSIKIYQI